MKGQTIIEVMIALAVGIVILSAVTTAVLTSMNNVQITSSQDLAGNLSLDGLELLRKLRDSDLVTFNNLSGSYCMAESCTALNNTVGGSCGRKIDECTQNAGRFKREVTIEKNASACRLTPAPTNVAMNGTQVSIKVSWKDQKCTDQDDLFCNERLVESCLFPSIPE